MSFHSENGTLLDKIRAFHVALLRYIQDVYFQIERGECFQYLLT
jgi:hypothetical protein